MGLIARNFLIAAGACAAAFYPFGASAYSYLDLEPSEYPAAVSKILAQVRSECREQGSQPVEDPKAGVTIIDLDRDGSKDILLDSWRACSDQMKNFGACNTAGCELRIFKQVGAHRWKKVLDEVADPDWFLSASEKGYFRLLALSVSRKLQDRCPDPDGGSCDFILYWKHGKFVWSRLR